MISSVRARTRIVRIELARSQAATAGPLPDPCRMSRLLTLVCLLLAVPVLGVLGSWLGARCGQPGACCATSSTTVLPEYALNSLLLARDGRPRRGAARRRHGGAGGAVRVPAAARLRVGAAAAAGDAGLRAGLRLHRLPAVQRPAADGAARAAPAPQGALWPDVRSLRGAVVLFVLCLYPYVYLLTRAALGERARAADGGGAPARRRPAAPRARGGAAAGAAGAGRRRRAGADGDAGRLRCWRLLRPVDLHHRHLQGLAGDERPRRRGAARLAAAGGGGAAAVGGAARAAAAALRRHAQRRGASAPRRGRCVLRGARAALAVAVCALPVLLGFVLPVAVLLRLVWLEAANAEFGLPLARFAQWAWTSFKLAGLAALLATALALLLGFALRLRESPALRCGGARGLARLCGAGRGDRGRHPAAGRLAAGALAAGRRGGAGHRHAVRPDVRLPGALLGGGAAVGRGRLRARAAVDRRDRAHARRLAARGCSPNCTRRCCARRRWRRCCWCSST